ncbi:synaptonemal complex central element protein 1-like isoform X3 [Branchiostoma floridae x Branchiostoma belcheri]
MSVKEPFRVEDLLVSVRELQKEKSFLEQELAESKRRTKETEKKLDEVSQQHRQISVLYNKMVETLKIAKHKVDQSQQMADKQEQVNQEKRNSLTELNSSIEREVQRQRQYSREFEGQLDELTDASHHAWLYFKAESIEKELQDLEAMKTEAERLAEQQEEEVSALTERLNGVKLQQGIGCFMKRMRWSMVYRLPSTPLTTCCRTSCRGCVNGRTQMLIATTGPCVGLMRGSPGLLSLLTLPQLTRLFNKRKEAQVLSGLFI